MHLVKHCANSAAIDKSGDPFFGGGSGGGCYVATAVYGSYDCPEVWVLRRFRDHTLAQSALGRAFIRAYYAVSPALVRRFGGAKWFRGLCKPPLQALVRRLRAHGVAGFVIHPRKGLPGTIPYLSDVYMHFVRHAVELSGK